MIVRVDVKQSLSEKTRIVGHYFTRPRTTGDSGVGACLWVQYSTSLVNESADDKNAIGRISIISTFTWNYLASTVGVVIPKLGL